VGRGWRAHDVVFEVLSPSNTQQEMADKRAFYEEHGVEEYYVYDPDRTAPGRSTSAKGTSWCASVT